MGDLTEKTSSRGVKITGGDEELFADVVLERGAKKLLVKSTAELSSELRIHQECDITVVLDDVDYYTVYSKTGESTISGFLIRFDDKKVVVKLVVDGQTIFDICCETFKEFSDWNSAAQPQTYISWNDGKRVFYFTPNFPVVATTSMSIEVRSREGESKKYLGSIIQVG